MNGENFAKILFDVSNLAFVLAACCAVLAIVIFFKCRIPTVFGDLTGRNARKSIRKMQESGMAAPSQQHRQGQIRDDRSTDKLWNTARHIAYQDTGQQHTEHTNASQPSEDGTTLLPRAGDETTLLPRTEATTLLPRETDEKATEPLSPGVPLKDIDKVIVVHTDETVV